MNRNEFINVLRKQLEKLPKSEVDEIIFDYEEHFNIGLQDDREESEIASSLGDPYMIAKELQANYKITLAQTDETVNNVFQAVIATLGLGFLNLVFVLGPFIGITAAIFSLFISGFAILVSGILIIVGGFFVNQYPDYISLPTDIWINVFLGIGMMSLGITFILVIKYIAQVFMKLIMKYLNFNINVIKNRRGNDE